MELSVSDAIGRDTKASDSIVIGCPRPYRVDHIVFRVFEESKYCVVKFRDQA